MSTLTADQRQAPRQELVDALEAWSKTEIQKQTARDGYLGPETFLYCDSRLFRSQISASSREIHAEP
jgi:hypothetical protein